MLKIWPYMAIFGCYLFFQQTAEIARCLSDSHRLVQIHSTLSAESIGFEKVLDVVGGVLRQS